MVYLKKVMMWMPVFAVSCLLSIANIIKCDNLGEWIIKAFITALLVLVISLLWMRITDKSGWDTAIGIIYGKFKRKEKS